MVITIGLSAVSKAPGMRRQAFVIRGERSAVSEGAEILGRIETVRGSDAEAADGPPATGGEMSLAAVLDDGQPVAGCHGRDPVHVCRLPVKMYRNDGGRPRRDRRVSGSRINREPDRVDVCEDRT